MPIGKHIKPMRDTSPSTIQRIISLLLNQNPDYITHSHIHSSDEMKKSTIFTKRTAIMHIIIIIYKVLMYLLYNKMILLS